MLTKCIVWTCERRTRTTCVSLHICTRPVLQYRHCVRDPLWRTNTKCATVPVLIIVHRLSTLQPAFRLFHRYSFFISAIWNKLFCDKLFYEHCCRHKAHFVGNRCPVSVQQCVPSLSSAMCSFKVSVTLFIAVTTSKYREPFLAPNFKDIIWT